MIKWGTDFNDNYNYGANIGLLENDSIRFSSPFMPTGSPIKIWHSKTEFHSDRKSPMLPILMNGKEYDIHVQAEFDNNDAVQLVVEFFDVNNETIQKIHFKDLVGRFFYPDEAISYNVQLVNKKHEFIIFKYLTISSDSLKERFEVKTNKSLGVICLEAKYPYEGIKTSIVVQKKSKYITSLVIEEYMNYYFLLDDQTENGWLEALTYLSYNLQNNLVKPPIYVKRGTRFQALNNEFRLLPQVLKVVLPICNEDKLRLNTEHDFNNLKDRVKINEYTIRFLQQMSTKQQAKAELSMNE